MSKNRADDTPRRTPWFEREDGVLCPEDFTREWEIEEPLEPGDLETGGSVNMDGEEYDWHRFSPWYHLSRTGISEQAIEEFAAEFDISDVHALGQTLALIARAVAEAEPDSTHVIQWHGQFFDASEQLSTTLARAKACVEKLGEMLSCSDWPVAMSSESINLRRALISYRSWLAEFQVVPVPGSDGPKPNMRGKSAAVVWGWAWPILTGEKPVVRRPRLDQPSTTRKAPLPPTTFQLTFCKICALFELGEPEPVTLKKWLNGNV